MASIENKIEKFANSMNSVEFCNHFFAKGNEKTSCPIIVQEAIEFERITDNQVPEQISHAFGPAQVTPRYIIRKVMEYMPEKVNSIVDVFNNGFAAEIAMEYTDKYVNCIVTDDAEELCINLRCGSNTNVEITKTDNIFKTDLSEIKSDFIVADLSNNPVVVEQLLSESKKKIKKFILNYNADVKLGKSLMNQQYNIQFQNLLIEEKTHRKINNTHKISSSSCGFNICQIEAIHKFKLTNYTLCGIALCMSLMNPSSTVAIIVNNSILTNKLNNDIRIALTTTFNLQKVVAIDSKRSLIIFSNDDLEEDNHVTFSELKYEFWDDDTFCDDEFGNVQIEHEKGTIKNVAESGEFNLSVKIIQDYGYNMSYAKCKHFNLNLNENYHLVEVGSISAICNGQLKDEDGSDNGKYDLYTKNNILKTDIPGFANGKILITNNEIVHRADEFNCTKDCVIIESAEEYYLLFALLAFYTNDKKSISKTAISSFRIPFPNDKDDIQPWIDTLWPLYQGQKTGTRAAREKATKAFNIELAKFKSSVAEIITTVE